MAKKDAKAREPDDREQNAAPASEGQHTEELPDIVVLDPEGSLPPGVTPESAVTIIDEQPEDEVYVILPEGDTSEIPVVETEALEDASASDDASETGDIAASETMPLDTELPAISDTESILQSTTQFTDSDTESVESRETQDLEEMAAELDDQVLAEAAGNTSELLAASASTDDELASESAAHGETSESRDASIEPVTIHTARKWFRVALAAAAVLTLSAVGFWYMSGMGDFQSSHVASTTPGGGSAQTPVDTTGKGSTAPTDPGEHSPGDSAAQEEARLASKQAFRGKLLAALDMGFGGEVKHE